MTILKRGGGVRTGLEDVEGLCEVVFVGGGVHGEWAVVARRRVCGIEDVVVVEHGTRRAGLCDA